MNTDKTSYFGQVSPTKSNLNSSYPRKMEVNENTKPIRISNATNNVLTESKENFQSPLTGGMRDVLLMKCKQAIEELHLELEGEKKLRQQLEENFAEAENESQEKDSELREIRYKYESLSDELKIMRNQKDSLHKELEQVEDQLKAYMTKESGFTQLQDEFQAVTKENHGLKDKLEELAIELESRNKIIKQWNETLNNVQQKIVTLEKENSDLKEEYQGILEENAKLGRMVEESENTNNLLQEKSEAVERLVQQLQKENKVIDNLRDQNENLREQVKEYQRNIVTFEEESHMTRLQYEEKFFKEREELEESFKEKNRRRINEIQDNLNEEIFRLKESNESAKNELLKVKSERDILKQEVVRLEDKLEKTEFESRKMSGTFANNYEHLVQTKNEEIERLKGVVDEQAKLITSYEKIIETEKTDNLSKVAGLSEQIAREKNENLDLKTKNEYLTNKLRECQEEVNYLKSEVDKTFTAEEEKQGHLSRKVSDLEAELLDRNTTLNSLAAQVDHLRNIERNQAGEIENLRRSKKEIEDEFNYTKAQMSELLSENDELREKQKDFYEILQGKINKISDELKQEREKRIQAQNLCRSQEERLFELEAKVRGHRKISSNAGERIPTKPLEFAETSTWNQHRKNLASTSFERHDQTIKTHHPDFDGRHRDVDHLPSRQETRESFMAPKYKAKEYSFDQKHHYDEGYSKKHREDIEGPISPDHGTPEKIHYQFVNKFKSVIEKLENKLERITADIDASTS